MDVAKAEILTRGLHFPEGPRWRDGALFVSDMHGDAVLRIDPESGTAAVEVRASHPSGLGWLPDGRLLVVTMPARQVLRREPDGELVVHADLSAIATADANDMLVDAQGRAYVGNFGAVSECRGLAGLHPDTGAARPGRCRWPRSRSPARTGCSFPTELC